MYVRLLMILLIARSIFIDDLQWVKLNDTEYNDWLNPVDQCMLKNNDIIKGISLQDHKSNVCRNVSHGQRALKCYIGMGVGHIMPCWPPFSGRSFFGQGIKGYTDFSMRYVEKIVDYINRTDETLIFVGDSVMGQAFDAFECQYVREMLVSPWEEFKWKSHIKFIGCSRGGKCDADHIISNLKLANSTVHIVRNFGLHYNDQPSALFLGEEAYKLDIVNEFEKLNRIFHSQKSNIIWMDTLHQHFHPTFYESHNPLGNGYYPTKRPATEAETRELTLFYTQTWNTSTVHSPGCCAPPISNYSHYADWRNKYVDDLFASGKYNKISRIHLPTLNMSDMHICTVHNRGKTDCTHYCYIATLWQPLWALIHSILLQ